MNKYPLTETAARSQKRKLACAGSPRYRKACKKSKVRKSLWSKKLQAPFKGKS